MPAYHVISAQDFKKTANVTVVDVRNPDEHDAQRLVRAHDLSPLGALDPDGYMLRHGLDKDAPVYILCKGGVRARTAADKFAARGYSNLYVIEGGIMACEMAGEPLVTGGVVVASAPVPQAKPDRRLIGAGIAALVGAGLSVVSPLFLIVPALAGGFVIATGLKAKAAPAAACASALPKVTGKSAGGCA